MLKKVIWSMKMNRCLFTYLNMYPKKEKEIIDNFLKNRDIIETQIITDRPLPFINGELAPAEYFYSLFTIEELKSENFEPKIFLVIDKSLDNKVIKIGDLVLIRLVYITLIKAQI